jgi:hypothetical protein
MHTFGFSAAHDPKALLKIAQQSPGGTYSFIEEGNLGKISHAFAICLGGLRTVVAVDVEVRICPSKEPSSAGMLIKKIESGGYKSSMENAVGVIVIDVLYAGEVNNFIVHFQVPAHASEQQVYKYKYSLPSDSNKYRHAPGEQHVAEFSSTLKKAQRPKTVDACSSRNVLEQIVRFKVLDILAQLHDKFNDQKNVASINNDDEEIHRARESQRRAGNLLKRKLDELATSDDSWSPGSPPRRTALTWENWRSNAPRW